MTCAPTLTPNSILLPNARFTVLTERLIRCEWSPEGVFEDGLTQTVSNRAFPEATFEYEQSDDALIIRTAELVLRYALPGAPFSRKTLTIEAIKGNFTWAFDQPLPNDLPGTLRTLDNANGLTNMMTGEQHSLLDSVISRAGWNVLDDSRTLRVKPDGFLDPRTRVGEDFYFFGYGRDYAAWLRDYHRLTGPSPLPPKFALGLWWSKWWPYRDSDLLEIIGEFEEHGVPLSVCVVDMDWHTVFNPHHSGWTGYTWNREFFADPRQFFRTIHAKGVQACLNLHPHQGVAPHEDNYERMCRRLGRDPSLGEIIPFDLADEAFLQAYFEELHHPLEDEGVDFWWMDWQQGETCALPGVDPLWYLNHLHARDRARDGTKRSLIFSRWCPPAAHRCPVGFSGDTYATWDTLNILPFFTAASANLGYGWRSDETGGFQRGDINDHELFTRWNQFACFSPTYRLHNCGDPGMDYRPWSKPAEVRDAILAAMRLRQQLLPYLYTAAHRHANGGPCLCRPMYHDYPEAEEAYLVPQQYAFGSDLIVAPFTRAADPETQLARQIVWLPEGEWYHFFSGELYAGGRFHCLYGGLQDIPVFARGGSVIPMEEAGRVRLRVFPGNGVSYLYDDDGEGEAWREGAFTQLCMEQRWADGECALTLRQTAGNLNFSKPIEIEHSGERLRDGSAATLRLERRPKAFTREDAMRTLLKFRILGHTLRPIIGKPNIDFDPAKVPHSPVLDEILDDPAKLLPFLADFTLSQTRCLFEQMTDSGFHAEDLHDGRTALLYWCGTGRSGLEARVAISQRFQYDYAASIWEPKTGHRYLSHDSQSSFTHWKANIRYGDVFAFSETS